MIEESIKKMIKKIIDTCKPWIQNSEKGLLYFIDPNDGVEISAHYGATHMAVALIIYGEMNNDQELISTGYQLLDSIIERWELNKKLPGFHNDFNNFAICVLWNYLEKQNVKSIYLQKIKEIILNTADSNNPTVNWLPMRWYVNLFKYKWTGEKKYKNISKLCYTDIKKATYIDGFIDDRLPAGLSFNLQYNIATVAIMQLLKSIGEEVDIAVELGALISAVAPDGDINYLGRGCNQIFAWGLWIYLLASSGQNKECMQAIQYLEDKLYVMLQNNNLMLNGWQGKEKYMWWDYHYCSVYTAHLLFWLVLSLRHLNKYPVKPKIEPGEDSGLKIYRSRDTFIAIFQGRKEYLAERGPSVALLWSKSKGMITKGNFGPWQNPFGTMYCVDDVVLRNYFGLLVIEENITLDSNRYIYILTHGIKKEVSEKIKPLFTEVSVKENKKQVEIIWTNRSKKNVFLNLPMCTEIDDMILKVDGKQIGLMKTLKLRNQYDWVTVYQSKHMKGNKWELIILK